MLNGKSSSRQIEQMQQEYKNKDRKVKRSVRKDKRNCLASEPEKREFGTVDKIT